MDIFIPAATVALFIRYLTYAALIFTIYEMSFGTPGIEKQHELAKVLPTLLDLDKNHTMQDSLGRIIMHYVWNGTKYVLLPIDIVFSVFSLSCLVISLYNMRVSASPVFEYSVVYMIWLVMTRTAIYAPAIMHRKVELPRFKVIDQIIAIFYLGNQVYHFFY